MKFSFRTTTSVAVLFVLSALPLEAQKFPINMAASNSTTPDAAVVPPYDVVSVKPHPANDPTMEVGASSDGIHFSNVSLKVLLANAYGLRVDQISGGPAWADDKGFDVKAKIAESDIDAYKKISPRQRQALLQGLLKERFHLIVHKETKDALVYDLTVDQRGLKMKPSGDSPTIADSRDSSKTLPRGMIMMGPGMLQADSADMKLITAQLASIVEHDVRDKTDLTGKYDVNLKYSSDEDHSGGQDNGSSEHAPEIFTALQEELGLKLVSVKAPVEALVIEHAELPSAD